MTRPLSSGKKSVNLAKPVAVVSRIRRDPPPKVKESLIDRDERNRRDALIGVTAVTFAVLILVYAFGSYSGWTPREYTVEVSED